MQPDTIPALLRRHAHNHPDDVALRVVGGGFLPLGDWSLSYGEWYRRAGAVALGLRGLGLMPGERVVLPCDNASTLSYAIAYVAVQLCGATAVPVYNRQGEHFLAQVVSLSSAVGILGEAESDQVWCRTVEALEGDAPIGPVVNLARPHHTAEIIYTSGTTGAPKGVRADHENLLYTLGKPLRPLPHQVLHSTPPGTNAGQTMMLLALHESAPQVATLPFEPQAFFTALDSVCPDHVVLVPTHARTLLRYEDRGQQYPHVDLVRTVAAPIGGATISGLRRLFPNAKVRNMLTSTEAWPAAASFDYDPHKPNALGHVHDTSRVCIAEIDNGEVRELPRGERGQILLRAPGAPQRAYEDQPPSGGSTFLADDWVRLGDVGYMDEDDFLYFVDRQSDLVVSGGHNISTLEVEQAALEHSGVSEAVAFGRPHSDLGEAMALAFTGRVEPDELDEFLVRRLGEVKAPKSLIKRDEMPRNALGKPLKAQLRDEYATAAQQEISTPVDPELLAAARAIWSEVFRDRTIADNDSFLDLGGTSLDAAMVVALVGRRLGREVGARLLIQADTLDAFAVALATAPEASEAARNPIPRAPRNQDRNA